MKNIIRKLKCKLYCFVLRMMLNDFDNGDLLLTGKQKSQIEALVWKINKEELWRI